jgi:hypothetical protein
VANFLYVDNSNVWIEGKRVAAVENGLAPDVWTAMTYKILDPTWNYDFGHLFSFAGGDKAEVGRAVLFGSRPPANDSVWKMAERCGFEVVTKDRNAANKEKKIDTGIATEIVADSFELMGPAKDEITLVAGDSDYVPTVERVRRRGLPFHVVFWDHAARELRDVATSFTSLNKHLEFLRRKY